MTTAAPVTTSRDGRVALREAGLREGIRRVAAHPGGQAALVMALALLVRVFVIVRAHGMLDGDEAVLGIQAEQILRGARPAYFAGQAYMGTWDAYLAAPLIALFGPSAALIHAITAAESLLLIPVMGALAGRLLGARARLPAMALSALPPLYVTVGELRMLGGYVETLVIGSALMLIAVVLRDRMRSGASLGRLSPLAGLLVGLGLWIDQLVVYYILACALWLLPTAIACLRREVAGDRARVVTRFGQATALFIGTAVIGASPALIYALSHHGANVAFVTHSGGNASGPSLQLETLRYYLTVASPRVLGISWIWQPLSEHALFVYALRLATLLVSALALGYLCLRALAPAMSRRLIGGSAAPETPNQRGRDAFALVLLATISLVFWRTAQNGGLSLYALVDAAGRYALPLNTVMTLAFARLIADLPAIMRGRPRRVGTWAAQVLLIATLLVNAVPYALTSGVEAMQSGYFHGNTFPAQDGSALGYLKRQRIRYIWTDHWFGTVVTYLEDGQVVYADYVDATQRHGHIRFPQFYALVAGADRPSFLIESDPVLGEPAVASALDALHVTYTMARFGRICVITPISRTVQPSEIVQALVEDYGQ